MKQNKIIFQNHKLKRIRKKTKRKINKKIKKRHKEKNNKKNISLFLMIQILFMNINLLYIEIKILFMNINLLYLEIKIILKNINLLYKEIKILYLYHNLLFLENKLLFLDNNLLFLDINNLFLVNLFNKVNKLYRESLIKIYLIQVVVFLDIQSKIFLDKIKINRLVFFRILKKFYLLNNSCLKQ